MTGIEGGSSSSSYNTARHSHWFGFKNENTSHHCVRFLLFKPRLIRQTYTERRRLAPEYMGLNTQIPTRTADESYEYHRTRVRSDSYTIFMLCLFFVFSGQRCNLLATFLSVSFCLLSLLFLLEQRVPV